MIDVTDEVLNAYVDGALDAETARGVEARLAHDAEARAYVETLRQINALAPEAMDALLGDVPQSLIDTIKRAPVATATNGKVVSLSPRRVEGSPWWRSQTPLLAAAALAVAICTAAAYVVLAPRLGDGPAEGLIATGPLPAASPLAGLLEQSETGKASSVTTTSGSAAKATVVATFKDAGGRYCRELEVDPVGAGVTSASIACRQDNGTWQVEGSVAVAAVPTSGPYYVPSGAADNEPLDPLVRSLKLGKALSSAEERAALTSHWTP